jgi:hypothetical protein
MTRDRGEFPASMIATCHFKIGIKLYFRASDRFCASATLVPAGAFRSETLQSGRQFRQIFELKNESL